MKISDIKFELDIKAGPNTIFKAVTTKKGYQGWWTLTCDINCKPDQESFIRFEKEDRTEQMCFRTKEIIENERLVWLCISNNVFSSWVGTELSFEIKKKGKGSFLTFTHCSTDPNWGKHPDHQPSAGGWDHFMGSLKTYCETGIGDPVARRGRKVRTAKGNAPVKRRVSRYPSGQQIVPQKITAAWHFRKGMPGVRLKTWGKSPRSRQVIAGTGKPCMLKCHVYRRLRAARPMPEGRQQDPCSNAGAR
jgi:uncharacterized protein YndB with AHSA1/START domain